MKRVHQTRDGLCLAMAIVLLISCGSQTDTTGPPATESSRPSATLTEVWPAFPQHTIGTGEPGWQALTTGGVTSDGRCITLVTRTNKTYLALWPPDYELVREPALRITTPAGNNVGLHQEVEFVGGELDASRGDLLMQLLDGNLPPDECRRPFYWVVTGFRPAR